MEKKHNWLFRIDSLAAWTLLVTILAYFLSGYGMTKGIIDSRLATRLHISLLAPIVAFAFIVHTSLAIRHSFIRWKIWNKATMIFLVLIYTFISSAFLYFQVFYRPQVSESVNNSSAFEESQQTEKIFTVSELSKYNGLNGNPSYVAVDGVVYDLSSVFQNGVHFGHSAGADLTSAFYSKHIKSQIAKFPVVGTLK